MTSYDVVPPPPPPRRSGCSTLAAGCAGMILGSILTIAVQLLLIGYGIDLLTRGWRDAVQRPHPAQPSVTSTVERVPEGFGGFTIAELAQRCDGGTFEVTDKKLHAACDEMRTYMRDHGAAPDVIP